MIHSTKEEVRILLYLIGYGIFIISTYDTLMLIVSKINKIIKSILSIIYVLAITYFTYEFSYVLASGYIPIHFILFLIIGFLIYYLIRKTYINGLIIIYELLMKIKKSFIQMLIFLIYPKEIINILLIIMGKIKVTIYDFWKTLKRKNKKME